MRIDHHILGRLAASRAERALHRAIHAAWDRYELRPPGPAATRGAAELAAAAARYLLHGMAGYDLTAPGNPAVLAALRATAQALADALDAAANTTPTTHTAHTGPDGAESADGAAGAGVDDPVVRVRLAVAEAVAALEEAARALDNADQLATAPRPDRGRPQSTAASAGRPVRYAVAWESIRVQTATITLTGPDGAAARPVHGDRGLPAHLAGLLRAGTAGPVLDPHLHRWERRPADPDGPTVRTILRVRLLEQAAPAAPAADDDAPTDGAQTDGAAGSDGDRSGDLADGRQG